MRHREETKVVSRLTMENMNLASRCREAISQVAALKKEVMVYQKQQSNVASLQKEVIQLRKQIDGKSGGSGHKKQPSSGSVGSPGNNSLNNGVKGHNKQSSSGDGSGGKSSNLENNNADRSDSPATDLDRIMSRQFRKQQDKSANSGAGAAAATKSTKGDGVHKNTTVGGSKTTSTTPTATTANNSTNKLLTSANTKIPISVTSSKSKHSTTKSSTTPTSAASSTTQNDDEFDADIDMVDFFAKSQLNSESPSSSLESTTHLGSRKTHSRKPKSTDDHMPGDVISVVSPSSSSPGSSGVGLNTSGGKKTSPSDSLISSLDAFEASFASAFPETSFSITSNITSPSSSAKLDMSFDVPEFDPFFKSPNSNTHHSSASAAGVGHGNNLGKNAATNGLKGSSPKMQDLFPESAMSFKSSTSPKLDIAFDSTTSSSNLGFTPIDKNKGGGGTIAKTSVAPEKLDTAFSRVQPKGGKLNASNKDDNNKQTTSQKRGTAGSAVPLSPQSMSAAIEQLDALAITSVPNLSSSPNENSANSGTSSASVDTSSNTVPSRMAGLRATRKVKQPISYAEPSTKSKLRRGDVLFPKTDADNKKSGVGSGLKTTRSDSPTTDLDRIMEKITASTSSSPDVQ